MQMHVKLEWKYEILDFQGNIDLWGVYIRKNDEIFCVLII